MERYGKKIYSSFPLFLISLLPQFSPTPGPLYHFEFMWLLSYSLASSVLAVFFFFILCRSWDSISWLLDLSLSSCLSFLLIHLSFPNLFFRVDSPPLVVAAVTRCWHYILSSSVLRDRVTWPCQQKAAKFQKNISSGDFSSQTLHLQCSRLE